MGFECGPRASKTYWTLHSDNFCGKQESKNTSEGTICSASHQILLPQKKDASSQYDEANKRHNWVERTQFLDTCGAFNIITRGELHDIKPAAKYNMRPMRMKCLETTTGWYKDVGISYAKDEKGITRKRLAYAYDGEKNKNKPFYLIAMTTLVDERIDLQYHMRMALQGTTAMLRRMPKLEPFKYNKPRSYLAIPATESTCLLQQEVTAQFSDMSIDNLTKEDLDTNEPVQSYECRCTPRVVESMSSDDYQHMVSEVHGVTDSNPQYEKDALDWDNYIKAVYPTYAPLEEIDNYSSEIYKCYMTEVQLQAIVNQQGIEATGASNLDMTTVDGKRVSKWSLDAIEYGKDLDDQWKNKVKKFLSTYVGQDSVFPTKNGAPRILTEFKDKPYKYELRDEYTKGPNPKPLPSIKAMYYHGKPATQKVLEHFVRSTPVVSRCDNPRCLSRLVIVPKRDPGAPKTADPTAYRVTMNALINGCLKPTPSTLPLALNEVKKLHHFKYYLKVDAANAYWSILLDAESRRMTAFQTHEGVFAWDRLTMGTRPASTVQQTAYHRAFDQYLPQKWRHRFASFADDVAAGANTLEELFELLKAIIICFDKAGIQIKASKLIFGVQEITFHNYTVSALQTRPKDENLDPIRNCAIPTSVTHVKAFLGCTQQMSHYCQYYGIVAAPLHALTRDKVPFPRPWLKGADYDVAFHRLKTMMINENLFLWNKISERRLFIEVDACEFGWGACAYQYAHDPSEETVEDEGRHRLLSKEPKRVVEWISKAWTEYERELPCFYREALARLLSLEHFRNLIETQSEVAGTTVYTDHAPSTYKGSLSNKGRLSSWRIHETQDLADMVQTLYKGGIHLGPPHGYADPLSRLPRGNEFHRIQLPAVLDILLRNLPPAVKDLKYIRVNAEKDTLLASRVVQRWRNPKNPISIVRGEASGTCDFLITAPYCDKETHMLARLIKAKKHFAALIPVSLLQEIDRDRTGKIDEEVRKLRKGMPTIIISPLSLAWLINHPDYTLEKNPHMVLYANAEVSEDTSISSPTVDAENGSVPNLYTSPEGITSLDTAGDVLSKSHLDFIDETLRVFDDLMRDGAVVDSEVSSTYINLITTRAQAKKKGKEPMATRSDQCTRGVPEGADSFKGSTPPDPLEKWVGHQMEEEKLTLPSGGTMITGNIPHYPEGLKAIKDGAGRTRIIVPRSQRIRLIKQEHLTLLHVGARRVLHALTQKYYWPKMKDTVVKVCAACPDCQQAMVRRRHLNAEILEAKKEDLPLPRQTYGIDFYGHAKGEILVAIDLVTREIHLWFLTSRKQETVAKALLSGLVFTKGVPLQFRSDEASEFVEGVVACMNRYLGIKQITTGGHNARGNATVERVMQTLGHMLRTAKDAEYNNIKDYIHCMAFGHNCTYNSVIEMSPFEAGHGLPARTVTEARMDLPRLQFTTEEGIQTAAARTWEKGLPKKIVDLAHTMAEVAQKHSQWHRRMNTERLNMAGCVIDKDLLREGQEVYFYKPPTISEVEKKGRKKKHLSHYHGPAIITGKPRERQYELTFNGKTFKRDIAMIIPKKHMPEDPDCLMVFDPTADTLPGKPWLAKSDDDIPVVGEFVICNDSPDEHGWFIAEVCRRQPTSVEVKYFATPTPPIKNYANETLERKSERISKATFRRTWYISQGKDNGKATNRPPYPDNHDLRVWEGPIPHKEISKTVLVRNVGLTSEGQLCPESVKLAAGLHCPHEPTLTVEDERMKSPALFLRSVEKICTCPRCSNLFTDIDLGCPK